MTKRPLILATFAALAALTVAAAPALAQKRATPGQGSQQSAPSGSVGRITPQQMVSILRERGMRAELVTQNNTPRIRTMFGQRRVTVFFYACNDGGCQSIQYRALYERNDRFTLAFVNAWNYEKRFAKTYLDSDNDLVLEWDVDFDGGVSVEFISESVNTFRTMINVFDRFTPRDASARGGDGGTARPEGGRRGGGAEDGARRGGSGGGDQGGSGDGARRGGGSGDGDQGGSGDGARSGGGGGGGETAPPADPAPRGSGGKNTGNPNPGERRT